LAAFTSTVWNHSGSLPTSIGEIMMNWIITHRSILLPLAMVVDGAAWTALIFFGWHYFN
jgi:hypothetical protein